MRLINSIAILAGVLTLSGCGQRTMTVVVANPLDMDRNGEMVAVSAEAVTKALGDKFSVYDDKGNPVQYQVTYDGNVIFPASVSAKGNATYTIKAGESSAEFEPAKVYGRLFPERKDDLAWENDKAAYRAYGPELERSGEQAFGYDIWTKSVDTLILEQRYHDALVNKISFHVDHGNGMDDYTVGPTLGGCTTALLDTLGQIVYPYCFSEYEVLDNGPLRFTASLTYNPLTVNGDTAVVEHRVITLDRGSYLNKTDVVYSGLTKQADVVAGIVVHKQNPDAYVMDNEKRIMAYADSTEHPSDVNGVIYIGTVVPDTNAKAIYQSLDPERGSAIGHILSVSPYTSDDVYTYYWGSGWSNGDMPDFDTWQRYLSDFAERAAAPLQVTLK